MHNYPKNRMDLEGIVVQMEYGIGIWNIFSEENLTNFEPQKTTFISLICRFNSSIRPHTKEMAVQLEYTPFPEVESVELFNILGKLY